MAETLREYTPKWLALIAPTIRATSLRAYEQAIRVRVLPFLGDVPLDQLSRSQLKTWFIGLLSKYRPGSAAHALLTLHTMLAAAVEDELIPANPASALRRALRGVLRHKREEQKGGMTAEQLQGLLAAASAEEETYPGLILFAFTGVRLGEAIGLQWGDVDFEAKALRVRRQVYPSGEIGTLKTGAGLRDIDLADRLANVLWVRRTQMEIGEERFGSSLGPWVLFPALGPVRTLPDGRSFCGTKACTSEIARRRLATAVKTACQRAGIPTHFSCHSLRHTIATLLFEQGAHPKYVQRLLGHSSLAITSDRYARFAKMTDLDTVERFAASIGCGTNVPLTGPKKNAFGA